MKTKTAAAGVLMAAFLAGCSGITTPTGASITGEKEEQEASQTGNAGTEASQQATVINPWRETTEEEADALIPRLFKVPEGAEVLGWMMMDDALTADGKDTAIVELMFSVDDLIFDARAQITGDDYMDISGMYYEWIAEEDVTLANWGDGHMQGKVFRGEDNLAMVDLITWYDTEIGISYSLSTAADDLDGFDIQAIAEQMAPAEDQDEVQ